MTQNPASAGFFVPVFRVPASGSVIRVGLDLLLFDSHEMSDLFGTRWPCFREVEGGVVLDLSIVPGAKRTALIGLHDDALRVRLQAPPVEGKANDALIAWLSDELRVPRRSIELLRGASSRRKQVRVEVSLAAAQSWLAQWMANA